MPKAKTAADPIIGATIKAIRPMTEAELDEQDWNENRCGPPMAMELSTGALIFPAQDSEGNGAGVFFYMYKSKNYALYGE